MNVVYQIAHDLNDPKKPRSKDVALSENVTFQDFSLSTETYNGLRRCGFEKPSPVQLESIPLGRCGFDLVVQSKAGTGKTCIFALVALEALQSNTTKSTQTLIVAPTREIAIQTYEVINLLGSFHKNLRCCLCIGGVEIKQDRANLDKLCQIVIGTPGRLKQLIELNLLKTQQIELFVLDEADKLMDEQFKKQIDEIYKRLPIDRQMIVTSATYPKELSRILQKYMQSPKCITFGKELSLEAVDEFYLEAKAGHSIKKNLENKLEALKALLNREKFSKCFIFTNYQARAPQICDSLNKDEAFVKLHGKAHYICAELSQNDRNNVFKNFKSSKDQKLLISTDVSARGIDIQEIELVINLDLPTDKETYFHRIGRSGRFGQPGKAVCIVSNETVDEKLFKTKIYSDRMNLLDLF